MNEKVISWDIELSDYDREKAFIIISWRNGKTGKIPTLNVEAFVKAMGIEIVPTETVEQHLNKIAPRAIKR